MRRHAKASTAGSTPNKAIVALALLCALGAALLTAAPAFAATVTDRPLLFTFNGSDTSAGTIQQMRAGIALDEASGSVYVLDLTNEVIDKFNANGVAASFSATGTSSLDGSETPGGEFELDASARIAVDDSAVNTGRIYVANFSSGHAHVDAFSPAGTFLWRLSPVGTHFNSACGVAVDTEGHLWIGDRGGNVVREYAASGSPPAEIGSFAANEPCALDVARNGDVYVVDGETLDKYVGGVLSSTVDTDVSALAVDQSSLTGHVFSLHQESAAGDSFKEFDSGGSLVGSFGAGVLYESGGIAYNPALDRVYVGQFVDTAFLQSSTLNTIKALGPIATGTVPDPTAEAASEVEISKAKLNGKVNPQSVPNAYFFEWQEGTSSFGWRRAHSSTPQSLAEDSLEHPVSFTATGLVGNTTYQARLVGLNTASGLRVVSDPVTFTTVTPAAPAVTIADPSAVGATSAEVSGTVNPEEDPGTTWRLQLSTDPACATGFSDKATHELESEANTPQPVAEALTGLLPNQHYCVRISATNGGGTTTSEVKEFSTDPVAPTLAETAFAAPRTDTSARLNGRLDPEGADATHPLTYRFEYSEDGGATWIALADQQYTGGAREQIVLADELTGLDPNTTYSYRFSAESDTGPASPQGAVKTFTTRSAAEMNPPKRGYELVNNPNKGTQNVFSGGNAQLPGLSPSGNLATWTVTAGAPGAPNGVASVFLAERTASGWKSRSLAPAAEAQVGGGKLTYLGRAATPDFGHFVFDAEYKPPFAEAGEAIRVRLDAHQHQDVLQTFNWSEEHDGPAALDITDDGAHVINIDHASDQLEEIGDSSGEVLSIMPDDTPSSCGLLDGASFVGGQNEKVGSNGGAGSMWRPGYHMISTTDASRVYFEAKPNGECAKPWGLYVRNRESEETRLIDPGTTEVEFITATPDGRQAYFATSSQLDAADSNDGNDVYRWDEQSEESSCLTCVVPDAGVLAPVLISKDLSHIYFESGKELVPGHPLSGSNRNVYVLSDGEIRFVALNTAPGAGPLRPRWSQLSDDGESLAFSVEAKPSYTADAFSGNLEPIYLYDDREESIECVSCVPGATTTHSIDPGFNFKFQLSADGSTLAFVTPEALTPLDVNGGRDVYEWRDGALRLITDGVTEFPTGEFAKPLVQGIDADGSSILFTAVAPGLTGYEEDRLANLYVARIGGGFERPSPVIHCEGEACNGPVEAPPPGVRSASSTFSGAGNLAPKAKKRQRPCAHKRGKAKQRCARKHKRHRKHSSQARAQVNAGRAK